MTIGQAITALFALIATMYYAPGLYRTGEELRFWNAVVWAVCLAAAAVAFVGLK
jgi:hypothetical protein